MLVSVVHFFAAEKIGILAYILDFIIFILGYVLLFGAALTAFPGHEARKYLVNNEISTVAKLEWLVLGVLIPLMFLGILCLIFTASSPYEVFAFAAES